MPNLLHNVKKCLRLYSSTHRCDPVYIKYRFHTLPEHCTPGHAHSRDITWDDSHVILLGTINHELLTEYFRGPRLVMEVHDRDRHLERERRETLFGGEQRDELLGTQAFGAGIRTCTCSLYHCCQISIIVSPVPHASNPSQKNEKMCFCPGSNRGPCACEAHVITTTPQKQPLALFFHSLCRWEGE